MPRSSTAGKRRAAIASLPSGSPAGGHSRGRAGACSVVLSSAASGGASASRAPASSYPARTSSVLSATDRIAPERSRGSPAGMVGKPHVVHRLLAVPNRSAMAGVATHSSPHQSPTARESSTSRAGAAHSARSRSIISRASVFTSSGAALRIVENEQQPRRVAAVAHQALQLRSARRVSERIAIDEAGEPALVRKLLDRPRSAAGSCRARPDRG